MPSDRELLDELVLAATNLTVVVDNAAVVLSEEFESMVKGPNAVVMGILERCPKPSSSWDGEFRIADCDIKRYTPDSPPGVNRTDVGCKITHRHTGLSVEVQSHFDFEINKQRAQRALADRVRRKYSQTATDPLQR